MNVREHFRAGSDDLNVTDNGDGTLTILVLATGNGILYGPDGKAITRNPGQIRFEVVIDHGGTPSDPLDDSSLPTSESSRDRRAGATTSAQPR